MPVDVLPEIVDMQAEPANATLDLLDEQTYFANIMPGATEVEEDHANTQTNVGECVMQWVTHTHTHAHTRTHTRTHSHTHRHSHTHTHTHTHIYYFLSYSLFHKRTCYILYR